MLDRALALLWFASKQDLQGLETREICAVIEQAGHAKQNASRLAAALSSARRRASHVPRSNAWRLHPHAQAEFDERYSRRVKGTPKPAETDSVLPLDLFKGTRGYIERVVYQANASFDCSLFDCCAVMCRRLVETLIIEVYETAGRSTDVQNSDGSFFMLSGLLSTLLTDTTFNLSRNAQQGLKDFKRLGDLSAHNRRYNARRSDIESVRDGLRVASEELLHLARLA